MEQINVLRTEITELEALLATKRALLQQLESNQVDESVNLSNKYSGFLRKDEVTRYSRQMLISSVGVKGQKQLKTAKVLIVGAGGLGCPSSLYLAAAGIGHITIVDDDEVELSNLHRQILHFKSDLGKPKVKSACEKLLQINNTITVLPLQTHVDAKTINNILQNVQYDVVIDATDNVATRYLLNDACVLNKIPLVSGSALQLEGQLTVYNYKGGPCYRCLYPKPPPPEAVTSCGDGGVLGAVPGVIGVLQAIEAIKIILGDPHDTLTGRILTFDAFDTTFRQIKTNKSKPTCEICGTNPTITNLIDYEQFCQAKSHDKVINIDILQEDEKIEPKELFDKTNTCILDVRPEIEYEICRIPNTFNVPYDKISTVDQEKLKQLLEEAKFSFDMVYVLCRRGNDSQRSIKYLKNAFPNCRFINVTGGLHNYAKQVDNNFPVY